ncbi:innexin inx2-like [Anopheles maculipalpis]|uniref:innexin inx2-like n=1 Tax=Anopheles maculipalpis TaxID=1496333 RepID=UPI002159644F|nr:innexin inx2-like [Anopheles maculipalpis]
MIEFARPLQNILRVKQVNSTDLIWRLHCRATVYLLLVASLLLSARQYFGNPIDCVIGGGAVPGSTMNEFCWIMGTYISSDPNFALDSTDLVKINAKIGHIPESERSYQKYYQWVVFILALQAGMFSLPNFLWKAWEAGRLQSLCDGLTSPIVPDDWQKSRKKQLIALFVADFPRLHRTYLLRYCFCTLLNFCNVLLNIFLLNLIFSGFWTNYHPAVTALLSFDFPSWNRYNSQVFPKIAKCDFHFIGPSGSKQNRDGLCLLSLNVVNEKIFAFLWLWFLMLLAISALNLLYWVVVLCSKSFRLWLVAAPLYPIRSTVVSRALEGQEIGKWFLLHQLCRNLNPIISRELLMSMSKVKTANNRKSYRMAKTGGEPDFYDDPEGFAEEDV